MKGALVLLLLAGCAGNPVPETTDSIKRGNAKLHISLPHELRWNTNYTVKILIQGNDSRFSNPMGYALVLSTGMGSSTFVVHPYILRYHQIQANSRNGLENRGKFILKVTMHPVLGYTWDGIPVLGSSILEAQQAVVLKGLELD